MKSYAFVSTMICVSLSSIGCGPVVEHQQHATTGPGGSGGGGAGGAAGSGGMAGGGGSALGCTKLVVQPTTVAVTAMQQSSPRIALDHSTGQLVYAFMNGSIGAGQSLFAMTANAFDAWPPIWTPALPVDKDVQSYAMSNGPKGPVGIVRHVGTPPRLIDSFVPQVKFVDAPLTDEGDPLFVTAIANRTFWGAARDVGLYEALRLGSYQPGSIPQSEPPLICAKPRLRAFAKPSLNGFVALMSEPASPNGLCDPANPMDATVVSISRYDSNIGLGSPLIRTQGWRFSLYEPVVNLGLAETSDGGAWVVFQTDGSISESIPPAMAARATSDGYVFGDGATDAIGPEGVILPALVAASLDNTLAAAWIDAIDPSAPMIQIRLHDVGQPMGLTTSISTNDAWYDGDLQILSSSEKRSLLLAWTSQSITAFARVDCIP